MLYSSKSIYTIQNWSYFCSRTTAAFITVTKVQPPLIVRFWDSYPRWQIAAELLLGQAIARKIQFLSTCFLFLSSFVYGQLSVGKRSKLETREQTPFGVGKDDRRLPTPLPGTVCETDSCVSLSGFWSCRGPACCDPPCSFVSGLQMALFSSKLCSALSVSQSRGRCGNQEMMLLLLFQYSLVSSRGTCSPAVSQLTVNVL